MISNDFNLTILFFILMVVLVVYAVGLWIAYWKLFLRANKPGWAATIPLYSTYVVGKIAKRPGLALLEIILLSVFIVALVASFALPSIDEQSLALLVALIVLVPLTIVDLKLEKYFLSQYTPSKLVSQLNLNLKPYSAIKKLESVKYKGRNN